MSRNILNYEVMAEIWDYLDMKSLHNFVCAYPTHAVDVNNYIASVRFSKKVLRETKFVRMGEQEVRQSNDDLYIKVGRLIRLVQNSPKSGYDTYRALLGHLEAHLPHKEQLYQEELTRLCERIQTGLHHCAKPETFASFVLERINIEFVKSQLAVIKDARYGTLVDVERQLRRHVERRVFTGREEAIVPSMLLKRIDASDRAVLVRLLFYATKADDTVDWKCFSVNTVHVNMNQIRGVATLVKQLWKHAGTSEEFLGREEILQLVESMIAKLSEGATVLLSPWSRVAMREFLRISPSHDLEKKMINNGDYDYLARFLEIFTRNDVRRVPFYITHLNKLVMYGKDRTRNDFIVDTFRKYVLNQHGPETHASIMEKLENFKLLNNRGQDRHPGPPMQPRAGPPREPRAGPWNEPRPEPSREPRAGPSNEPRAGPSNEPRPGPSRS